MSSGYVYILINQSMPGLIKIGRTLRDSRERARELHTTGVPTPFELAFEVFSNAHEALEEEAHKQLQAFRVNTNREFFRFPLSDAIGLLIKLNLPLSNRNTEYAAESIFYRLRNKHPTWLRPEIVDVRIVQTPERVWLEVTEEEEIAGCLVNQTIHRSDLAFIVDGDYSDAMFLAGDDVSFNTDKFVSELDPYSLINTTDIFNDDAFKEIQETLNPDKSNST
jgi:hypothetical protein